MTWYIKNGTKRKFRNGSPPSPGWRRSSPPTMQRKMSNAENSNNERPTGFFGGRFKRLGRLVCPRRTRREQRFIHRGEMGEYYNRNSAIRREEARQREHDRQRGLQAIRNAAAAAAAYPAMAAAASASEYRGRMATSAATSAAASAATSAAARAVSVARAASARATSAAMAASAAAAAARAAEAEASRSLAQYRKEPSVTAQNMTQGRGEMLDLRY